MEMQSSTWNAVAAATYIAALIGFLCLVGYEVFRRDPIVGKYVYDRKRLTQPGRTPPPLMLSRSLWRGRDDDDDDDEDGGENGNPGRDREKRGKRRRTTTTSCCRVRPAILEIIFLNLDPNYVRYSWAADEARKERERRGHYACCRTGCFHDNCCNTHVSGRKRRLVEDGGDFTVDEDGYAFYPGYCHHYCHLYESRGSAVRRDALAPLPSAPTGRPGRPRATIDPEDVVGVQSHPRWSRSIADLFHDQHDRRSLANAQLLDAAPPRPLPRRFYRLSSVEESDVGSVVENGSVEGETSAQSGESEPKEGYARSMEIIQRIAVESNALEEGFTSAVDSDVESDVDHGSVNGRTSAESDEREPSKGYAGSLKKIKGTSDSALEERLIGNIQEPSIESSEPSSVKDDATSEGDEPSKGEGKTLSEGEVVTDSAVNDLSPPCSNTPSYDGDAEVTNPGSILAGGNKTEEEELLRPAMETLDDERDERGVAALFGESDDLENPSMTGSSACSRVSGETEEGERDESDGRAGNGARSRCHVAKVVEVGEDGDEEDDDDFEENTSSDSDKPLKYPHRLSSLFLPLGFHSWTDALKLLGYFFYVPGFFRLYRKIPRAPLPSQRRGFVNERTDSLPTENLGMDLTASEQEFLRRAGLETYLLVRLARFGFDVTFYPFFVAVVTILPIYESCRSENPSVNGYLALTINIVPSGDRRIIGVVVFTAMLYLYIMRRLWYEWEVFIQLRHSFLANGDTSFYTSPTYLRTYRNTCMVECVPKTHRSDQNLTDVFESLFPGQIEHAEMLVDTSKLEGILKQRQKLIEKYDSLSARYLYQCWRYNTWKKDGKLVATSCNGRLSEPVEPKVRIGGLFSGKKEDAFAHYSKKIKEIDEMADKEYVNIVKARTKWRNTSILRLSSLAVPEEEDDRSMVHNLYSLFAPSSGGQEQTHVFSGTGIIEFKSIAAKQSAVQCNLSGQPDWMVVSDAPDPRDLFWSNIGGDRHTIETRRVLVNSVLFVGILAWSRISNTIQFVAIETLKSIDTNDILISLVGDYLPALTMAIVLIWVPHIFFLLAKHVIRFKSHSQCDDYVMVWNTAYRLANVFVTLFPLSVFDAFDCFREQPEEFINMLAAGVIRQSAVLMNLIIIATGQETMLQLLQWRSLLKQAVLRPLINLNNRSRWDIDWLNTAPWMEQSFLFGFYAPVLAYGLMIAMIYAFMCPLVLGICAIFFWSATKVHTHNSLFVFCQDSEGGGKIFYYWNRIVFITLYSSIVLFSIILVLKRKGWAALAFIIVMTLFTYYIDKSVTNTFVVNSLNLPICIARIHDEEEAALLRESKMQFDGGENFMYRHPLLNQENWNSKR